MIPRINHWLASPIFPDDAIKTRRAYLLNAALINIATLMPVIFIGNLLGGRTPLPVLGANVLAMALCLLFRSWMCRGQVRLASIGLMTMGFALITVSLASLGTVRAPTAAMYLLLVITGGLLFDLPGMVIITGLCSLAIGGLIGAGNAGWLPRPDYTATITQWVAYTAICGWTGSLTYSALRALSQALARADSEIVERKQAEKDSREAHQLLETIFDHTHMMVAYLDPQFNFIRVNRAYALADEREPEFFPGKNHFALYPNAENEATFRRVVATGKPHFAFAKPFEYAEHLERGVSYWDWSLVPIKDPDNAVTGLVLTLLNVTDRLWAEQALRESEVKFGSIYAQSPLGIEIYNSDGRLIDANPACLAIFGVSDLKAVMGFDLFHDPNLPNDARTKLLVGEPVKYEAVFDFDLVRQGKLYATTRSGKSHLDCLITPLLSDKGATSGYLVHVRDITERKRAEEGVKAERQRLFGVLEALPAMICLLTPDHRVAFANRSFRDKFGESLGRPCYEFCFGETAPCEFCQAYQVLETGQPQRWEVITGDGSVLDVYDMLFTDTDGSKSILEMNIDITARKRAEEALCDTQERLSALASYLQTAREEERTHVAREIHDEFGQTLTALKMDFSWLTRRLPQRRADLLAKVNAMSGLVDGAIDMVRRIAAELRPGLLDDLGLVAAIEWYAQEFAERAGLACELRLGDQELMLDRDLATALFRILQEALTNVARHAGATRVEIALDAQPECLTLVVRDDGKGIDPAQVFAAHSLGLLGMRERARVLGGEVAIEGNPGQGTTVTARIPRNIVP